MSTLWPRLHAKAATYALDQLDRQNPAAAVALSHRAQTFASTGGTRASEQTVRELRKVIVDVASAHGWPSPPQEPIAFDRAMAPALYAAMPMTVGEAATRPVWSFVSVVVAPDITAWRFGFANVERWVCSDRTRHMFSRLWWQEHLLGDEPATGERLLDGLSERDLNQLLERTSMGGCRPLVRALASEVLQLHQAARGREVVGDASLRLLRYMSFVDFWSLDDAAISEIVSQVVSDCVRIHFPGAATGRALPPPPAAAASGAAPPHEIG